MDAHCIPSPFLYVFEIFPKKKLEKNNYLNGIPSKFKCWSPNIQYDGAWKMGPLRDNYLQMKPWGWGPCVGIGALIKDTRDLANSVCHVKIRQESGCLQARKRTLTPLILDFPTSGNMRNKCLFFKPPSVRHFRMRAEADWQGVEMTGVTW